MTQAWHKAMTASVVTGLVLTLAIQAQAGVRYVNDDDAEPFACASAQHTTITEALAASEGTDEIRICPGIYDEQVVITSSARLVGLSFGSGRPVIKPSTLPVTLPGLESGNPVAAALMADQQVVTLENIDVDLSDAEVAGCSPALAGIYFRNTSGAVSNIGVMNVAVSGDPTCNSGVGFFIESGPIDFELGRPVYGLAKVNIRDLELTSYQKAGLVANGPRTIVSVKDSSASGSGSVDGAFASQIGFQVADGAKGRLSRVASEAQRSGIEGETGVGVLLYGAVRTRIRQAEVTDSQTGVFVFGERLRVKKSEIVGSTDDGIVFVGDANVSVGNFIDGFDISGVSVHGDRNRVKGGLMKNGPIGVWFVFGFANKVGSIDFENVPLGATGPYQGIRDLNEGLAAPFRP